MDKRGIVWVALVAVAISSGCAENRERANEQDLARIARWLPGTYNNTQQAQADARKGVRPAHDAVELAIVPLDSEAIAVAIGRNAFYVQEMAADDPRRVLSQKVVIFKATGKGITETVATLVEPLRWRDGQREPGIFMGLTTKDLSVLAGCDLTWKRAQEPGKDTGKPTKEEASKAAEHLRFIGSNDSKQCRMTSHVVMGLVPVEWRAELTADEFATAELQYDSNGQLLSGSQAEPFYRFRKTGGR
jgi:hypothetical protein